jgi:hypothetical protein
MPIPHRAFQLRLSLTTFCLLLILPSLSRAANLGDISLGYSRTGDNTFYPNVGGLNGWDLDGQVRWKPFIGVEGDVAHYGLAPTPPFPAQLQFCSGPSSLWTWQASNSSATSSSAANTPPTAADQPRSPTAHSPTRSVPALTFLSRPSSRGASRSIDSARP